jgi:hypothetical protein
MPRANVETLVGGSTLTYRYSAAVSGADDAQAIIAKARAMVRPEMFIPDSFGCETPEL